MRVGLRRLFFAFAALTLAFACSKKKQKSEGDVHTLGEEIVYTGGTQEEATAVQKTVEKIADGLSLPSGADGAALDEVVASSSNYDGQPAGEALKRYLLPNAESERAMKILAVHGALEGDRSNVEIEVEGKTTIRVEGQPDHEYTERGTYAAQMVREGNEWKIASYRPLEVAFEYGNGFAYPGLLVEATINGTPMSPTGSSVQVRAGETLTLTCRFLGDIGETMRLAGVLLDRENDPSVVVLDEDSKTYQITGQVRADAAPGSYHVEVTHTVREDATNGTTSLVSFPVEVVQ